MIPIGYDGVEILSFSMENDDGIREKVCPGKNESFVLNTGIPTNCSQFIEIWRGDKLLKTISCEIVNEVVYAE